MTTTDPLSSFGTNIATPQNQPAPGRPEQVKNNAGGYVFQIDPLSQLRRFLTIGTSGGTYYVGQDELTKENGELILALTKTDADHRKLVDTIVEISLAGRAPKQNPALFALAIACQHGKTEAKQYARKQITKVVRTGTHLFIFMRYLKQFGGINRGLRREIGKWYTEKSADKLAYQLVKYRQREGYTHRDVLRLVHPKLQYSPEVKAEVEAAQSVLLNSGELSEIAWAEAKIAEEEMYLDQQRAAIDWAVKGLAGEHVDSQPRVIQAFNAVQDPGNRADIPEILKSNPLPWEALPDEAMNDPKVWDVMLDNGVPVGALLRQLPRLTKLGMLPQMGGRTNDVINTLLDEEALHKARIHPINVLIALKTYRGGHGIRSEWTPTAKIVDALDEMFYASFRNVEPTGLRRMDALDVSGSMGMFVGGKLPLTAREVSAAMAMISVRTEPNQMTTGFTSTRGGWSASAALSNLPISPKQRLDDVIRSISNLPFGGTDCALPMLEAERRGLEIDTFVIYTDNETWHGRVHPFQALKQYRRSSGIDARLVVVSITPTKFSIADPSDPGMLDISGFDSAVPNMISDFALGRI